MPTEQRLPAQQRMAPRSRRVIVLVAAAALLLALALGSGAHLGSVAHPNPRPLVPTTQPSNTRPVPGASASTMTYQQQQQLPPLPSWVGVVLVVVMALGCLVALVVVAVLTLRALRGRRMAGGTSDETPLAEPPQHFTEQARAQFRDSVARLRAGDDLDATILACWRALEDAAAATGVPREPSQTATEFTVALLDATPADPADLDALASLYRRAMFGNTAAQHADRDRALACLGRLETALTPTRDPVGEPR